MDGIAKSARQALQSDLPLTHNQWMACYSAVAAACTSGRPTAVYDTVDREMRAAVDQLTQRLVGFAAFELLLNYEAEYQRFICALRVLHDLFGYLNRTWAGAHGQRGVAPRPGVHDTTALGMLTWRDRLVAPLTKALHGAMLDAIDAERDARDAVARHDGVMAGVAAASSAHLAPLSAVLVSLSALGLACDRAHAPSPLREFAPRAAVAVGGTSSGMGSLGRGFGGESAGCDGSGTDEDEDEDDDASVDGADATWADCDDTPLTTAHNPTPPASAYGRGAAGNHGGHPDPSAGSSGLHVFSSLAVLDLLSDDEDDPSEGLPHSDGSDSEYSDETPLQSASALAAHYGLSAAAAAAAAAPVSHHTSAPSPLVMPHHSPIGSQSAHHSPIGSQSVHHSPIGSQSAASTHAPPPPAQPQSAGPDGIPRAPLSRAAGSLYLGFEAALLERTRIYFDSRRMALLNDHGAIAYLEWLVRQFRAERALAAALPSVRSRRRLFVTLKTTLLDECATSIESAISPLLRAGNTTGLRAMYALLRRLPHGLPHMATVLQAHILAVAKDSLTAVLDATRSPAATAARPSSFASPPLPPLAPDPSSTLLIGSSGGFSGAPSLCEPLSAHHYADAIETDVFGYPSTSKHSVVLVNAFVAAALALHSKFESLVTDVFESDSTFVALLARCSRCVPRGIQDRVS